jgi:putative membrane protein
MKKLLIFGICSALTGGLLTGCGNNPNPVNTARESANEQIHRNANSGTNTSNTANSNTATSNSNSTGVVQDNFWAEAAQGGMAEVELAKLAVQKAQNAEVKKFAQMMITDHSKANEELKALAATKKVILPTDIGSHKSDLDDLGKLSGAEFDKKYVEMMVEDHEKDVSFFESKTSSSDADIKAFTTKTLPTLKKHLEAIKDIESKMKKS